MGLALKACAPHLFWTGYLPRVNEYSFKLMKNDGKIHRSNFHQQACSEKAACGRTT
jgi:hypothetical protein